MKVYPEISTKGQVSKVPKLTRTAAFMRRLALLVAFVSVFAFFIKILFY